MEKYLFTQLLWKSGASRRSGRSIVGTITHTESDADEESLRRHDKLVKQAEHITGSQC